MSRPIGKTVLAVYGMAAVIRLAFFNVTEEKRQAGESGNREFYQGLPVTSISIILPLIFFVRGLAGAYFPFILHIAVIITAILFISDIKIKKPQKPGIVLIFAVVALTLAKIFHLI